MGFLSDSLSILAARLFLIVVVILFLIQRTSAPVLSIIAALFGIAAALLVAWTNILFVNEEIALEEQVRLFYISMALLGPWYILVNLQARRDGLLSSRLTMFGIGVGIGHMVMFLLSHLLGGYEEMMSMPPDAVKTNTPCLSH